jgi:hypothetical protein
MMAVEAGSAEWLVVANVTTDGVLVLPGRIDFPNCELVNGELRAQVAATSSDEAKEQAETLFRGAVWSLLLASQRYCHFETNYVRNVTGKPSRTIYVTGSVDEKLTDEDTRRAIELYGMLQDVSALPGRLKMALSDLQCAMSDGTPFAFVHLHRCLEQIKAFFGGWPAMRADLNLSEGYLMYISTRRHDPQFGTAHAPVKRGPRARITGEEIREGILRAVEVLKRFLYFLTDRPVGEPR